MRRGVVVLAVLGVLCAACSGGGGGSATSPAPAVGEGTQETATVDRILAALDGVIGDLQRILVKERRITPEVTDRLRAIYAGPELLNQIDAFRTDVANGMAGVKDPPGNRVTRVSRLITVSPACIFVEVTRDYGPTTAGPAPKPATLFVVLADKDEADDRRQLNPTPWTMLYDGVQADGSQPDDVCR